MEKESLEGFSYDAGGNVDVAEDFPEPEFIKKLVDEDDLFDYASDILDESSISINSSVGRLPNSFLAMETSTGSSTSLSIFCNSIKHVETTI